MVTTRDAYQKTKQALQEAGVENAGFEADALLQQVLGTSRHLVDELGDAQWRQLRENTQRRAQREPLQYILGHWPFLGLELRVGPGVLIPRPETEEVCLLAAECVQGQKSPAVLDLCAGSGALALGLQSLLPEANVTALEWDAAAFGYLEQNVAAFAERGGRAPACVRGDVFTYHEGLPPAGLDLIVSNPPYVTEAEYQTLAPEVWREPKQALVPRRPGGAPPADDDGLLFYRAIARDYRKALKSGGALVLEIGSGQGAAVQRILETGGYQKVAIRQDLAGLDRIALGFMP